MASKKKLRRKLAEAKHEAAVLGAENDRLRRYRSQVERRIVAAAHPDRPDGITVDMAMALLALGHFHWALLVETIHAEDDIKADMQRQIFGSKLPDLPGLQHIIGPTVVEEDEWDDAEPAF